MSETSPIKMEDDTVVRPWHRGRRPPRSRRMRPRNSSQRHNSNDNTTHKDSHQDNNLGRGPRNQDSVRKKGRYNRWTSRPRGSRSQLSRQRQPELLTSTENLSPPHQDSVFISDIKQRSLTNFDSTTDQNYKIENVEYIASYNWMGDDKPTIVVPGQAAQWTDIPSTTTLPADTGSYLVDINSALHAQFPLEPSLRAILTLNPTIDLSDIDIFACGSTIGNLLSFVKDERKSFRMGVELIDESLILVRKTNEVGERLKGVTGYGHNFVETCTSWGNGFWESRSHQRIVKYDFAGLKCFIRAESDGYLPEIVDAKVKEEDGVKHEEASSTIKTEQTDAITELKQTDGNEDTSAGLDEVGKRSAGLNLRLGGSMISQDAVVEIKTRAQYLSSGYDQDKAQDFAQTLWVKQIPNLVLAYHHGGEFGRDNMKIIDMKKIIAFWEKKNQEVLVRLRGLLHHLRKLVRGAGQSVEIRREGFGPLELWSEVDGWSALPNDLKVRWEQH